MKKAHSGSRWSSLVIVLGLALGAQAALAQNWPTKPIRMILPFAGGTDTVGRLLATKLSTALGQ